MTNADINLLLDGLGYVVNYTDSLTEKIRIALFKRIVFILVGVIYF